MIGGVEMLAGSQNTMAKVANANSTLLRSPDDKALMDACQQFEAIFIKQMLSSMRQSVNKSGLINGGMTENIFEDWLYDEYANKMAKTGDFGLAQTIFDQMKSLNAYNNSLSVADEKPSVEIVG